MNELLLRLKRNGCVSFNFVVPKVQSNPSAFGKSNERSLNRTEFTQKLNPRDAGKRSLNRKSKVAKSNCLDTLYNRNAVGTGSHRSLNRGVR